jgi:hypothetical protein
MQPARLKEVRPNAEKKFKTQAPIWEKIPDNIQRNPLRIRNARSGFFI